jgi:hypothetical protein
MDLEAEGAGSRWNWQFGCDLMGYAALGRGDRAGALAWFRKADEHPPVGSAGYIWSRTIRKRILDDDPWPSWTRDAKK